MSTNPGLEFDNLPLVEAAVRASFNGPSALTYSLINAIATTLKSSFPQLTESKQFEAVPGAGQFQAEIGPAYLPGAVYAGHTSGITLSVQPQVIVARWVKHPSLNEQKYPRFGELRRALWNAVEAFRKASGNEFPGIAVVNMSYVNFIPASDPSAVLKTYFAEKTRLGAMDSARQVRKLEAAWSNDDNLDVRFSLEQATAKLPAGVEQGYRLTTAAGLRMVESVDAKAGLEVVHDTLQTFFLELISQQAKDEWQYREVVNE
ncbi:MAG: hypothetical protein IH987_14905 [Planctomycetes bacterium]|nr:hypothetical protein [Planctomycetota bacterium]